MFRHLPAWAKLAISAAAIAGSAAGGLAAASAATNGADPTFTGSPIAACVNITAKPYSQVPWRGLWQVYTAHKPHCPEGSFRASFASSAQLSSAKDAITQNAADIASNTAALSKLQGVGSSTSTLLQDPSATPPSLLTGGGFVSRAPDIGTLNLPAGTYLINVNAKATPNKDTGTAQVFPQFFVYNQVKNASFAGDLFNVGAGALEPYSTNHDSYYSGSDVITVPAGGWTLHVYAFGYDSDQGAGSYALVSATITAVHLASCPW